MVAYGWRNSREATFGKASVSWQLARNIRVQMRMRLPKVGGENADDATRDALQYAAAHVKLDKLYRLFSPSTFCGICESCFVMDVHGADSSHDLSRFENQRNAFAYAFAADTTRVGNPSDRSARNPTDLLGTMNKLRFDRN